MRRNDVILRTITAVVVPIIVLFSVRLFFAGHYYPGGGFIGGLMTAGAIVLLLLAFDIETVRKMIPINYKWLVAIGLLFAVGTGVMSMFLGRPFLTHAFEYVHLPLLDYTSLHTAVLFDLGVYFVVIGVTMIIIETIGESD
ncbi:Na(+)/H(+) antiporter subunit B [Anoxybacillus sp. ST4]|uniref:Na(+)/H(+) antiporter subunit B n=1 Tax=Anoxybacillus sp. ST4 TaxID=2864181 RepID=UPI001C63EB22|nr:Na(+)/H(+) antiporter subunit B [Anoxybacillus sp. ST4]MBW7651026.1 Na(+)/H(+) antiporter subunit B [Anoxybacillus sp. ST4]